MRPVVLISSVLVFLPNIASGQVQLLFDTPICAAYCYCSDRPPEAGSCFTMCSEYCSANFMTYNIACACRNCTTIEEVDAHRQFLTKQTTDCGASECRAPEIAAAIASDCPADNISTSTVYVTVQANQVQTVTVSSPRTVATDSTATDTTTISNIGSSTLTVIETETETSTASAPAKKHRRDIVVTITSTTTVNSPSTVTTTVYYDITATTGYISSVLVDTSDLQRTTSTTTVTRYSGGGRSPSSSGSAEGVEAQQTSNPQSSGGGGGDSGGTNVGAIAGGVVGGVAFLAILGGIGYLVLRKKRQMKPNLPEMQRYPVY